MLTVQLFRDGQKMILTAEFHANLYSSGFIARMMQCYAKVLSGLMKEERLNQVALLPEEQLDELDAFNRTGSEYDSSQSVVSLFRRQAAAVPENVAIILQDRQYTYREVDEVSERIGQYIHGLGLGKGDVVSILIPRCEYMVIASLGALKAGCPISLWIPPTPAERLTS